MSSFWSANTRDLSVLGERDEERCVADMFSLNDLEELAFTRILI
jgi:hypothetical protein